MSSAYYVLAHVSQDNQTLIDFNAMNKRLLKVAICLWFWATNIVSAAALESAIRYPFFRYQYILLAVILWSVYLPFWYRRIKRERNRGQDEPIWRYYWRTRLSKGAL